VPPNPNPGKAEAPERPRKTSEWILSPDPDRLSGYGAAVADLLGGSDEITERSGALLRDLAELLDEELRQAGGSFELLPERIRLLGPAPTLHLPWELVPTPAGALGEDRLLVRGTNFLHFSRRGGRPPEKSRRLALTMLGDAGPRRGRCGELESLALGQDLEINWHDEASRLIHALGTDSLEPLLAGKGGPREMLFLEAAGPTDGESAALDELALQLLSKGCRRVLAPLAPFTDDKERQGFLSAFYGRIFGGESVGEALLRAQQLHRARFGERSGWFFYRIFGQADGSPLPAGFTTLRREPLSSRI
jgi:hypothetical protein